MKIKGFFDHSPLFLTCAIGVVFGIGLVLRLVFLTSPPLDFLSGRQLRSAVIARGMYCALSPCAEPDKRQVAVAMWKVEDIYEPQIFERLVSSTYLLVNHETLWVSRLYSALFWLGGAIALFDLARRMTSVDGALVTVGCYAVMNNIVIPGRSFQPEPLTTLCMILAVYSLYRWAEGERWLWALFSGFLGGIAILIKVTAVFPISVIFSWLIIQRLGRRRFFRNWQVRWMAFLLVVIPSSYYFLMIGPRSSGFFQFWSLSFLDLLIRPGFYIHWLVVLHGLFSLVTIFAGWIGALSLAPGGRAVILGGWLGYFVYGLFLPHQVTTHNYYNLILSPFIALGLSPIGMLIFQGLSERLVEGATSWHRFSMVFWKVCVVGITLLALFYPAWFTFSLLKSKTENLQGEVAPWVKMGEELPRDGQMIALTHDYGNRLRYYGWRMISTWPYSWDQELLGDQGLFLDQFKSLTNGKKYFLVTEFSELEAQPELKNHLYSNYPIVLQGNGYILFDLSQTVSSTP